MRINDSPFAYIHRERVKAAYLLINTFNSGTSVTGHRSSSPYVKAILITDLSAHKY